MRVRKRSAGRCTRLALAWLTSLSTVYIYSARYLYLANNSHPHVELDVKFVLRDDGHHCLGINCALISAVSAVLGYEPSEVLIVSVCSSPAVETLHARIKKVCVADFSHSQLQRQLHVSRTTYIFFRHSGDVLSASNFKAFIARFDNRGMTTSASNTWKTTRGTDIFSGYHVLVNGRKSSDTRLYNYHTKKGDELWLNVQLNDSKQDIENTIPLLNLIRTGFEAIKSKYIDDAAKRLLQEVMSSCIYAVAEHLLSYSDPLRQIWIHNSMCDILNNAEEIFCLYFSSMEHVRTRFCEHRREKDLCLVIPFVSSGESSANLPMLLDSIRDITVQKEIILVEDASAGSSVATKVRVHADQKDMIQIRSPFRGAGGARNFGLDLCTAKYVMFVDADDKIYPECITRNAQEVIRHDLDAIQMQYTLQYEDVPIIYEMWHEDREAFYGNASTFSKFMGLTSYPWTTITRRSLIQSLQPFDHTLVHNDVSFHFWIGSKYQSLQFSSCSAVLHIKKQSGTLSSARNEGRMEAITTFRLLKMHFCSSVLQHSPECDVVQRFIQRCAQWNLNLIDNPALRKHFRKALEQILVSTEA